MAKRDSQSDLKNIGPKTRLWLEEIGIHTRADIESLGSVEVYRRLKASRPREVSLNALYGLEAALLGISYTELPPDLRQQLREAAENDSSPAQ